MGFTRSSVADMARAHARFLDQCEEAAQSALELGASAAQKQVQVDPQFTPRSGNLQKRTATKVIRTRGGFLMRLTNDAPYAAPIDKGAAPHPVNHPGNRPYRFLSLAHMRAGSVTERVLRARLGQIAARF